jgi:hypothetical protein
MSKSARPLVFVAAVLALAPVAPSAHAQAVLCSILSINPGIQWLV